MTFSAATDKFHAVTGAIVNGSSITMTAGTFRYVTKEADRTLDIVIQTITLAAEYTGKADIIKNFKDIEPARTQIIFCKGRFTAAAITATACLRPLSSSAHSIWKVLKISQKTAPVSGLRIYNRKAGSNKNEFAFDVILARQYDVWCLDMGSNNIIYKRSDARDHITP